MIIIFNIGVGCYIYLLQNEIKTTLSSGMDVDDIVFSGVNASTSFPLFLMFSRSTYQDCFWKTTKIKLIIFKLLFSYFIHIDI